MEQIVLVIRECDKLMHLLAQQELMMMMMMMMMRDLYVQMAF